MKLKDKVALITGSSRGIGRATAILFAKEGAKIVVNYKENKKAAQEVVGEIESLGGQAIAIQADVAISDDVKKVFAEALEKFGTIDILVNNAGIVISKPFLERTLEDWNTVHNTNITSIFLCSQEAAKIMLKKKSGTIINVSSIRGLLECGRPPIIDYCTSKAAVISFTKTLAKELAPNIRVNAVAPGMTNTDIAKGMPKELIEKFIEDIYLGRLIEPEEVATTILFLASEEASGVTGDVIMVDGGQSLS